jgi:aspartate ammonia-lyase
MACAQTNMEVGFLDQGRAQAIMTACQEIVHGKLHEQIVVDAFQGGAGTSTNMNFNEVIANRALEISGRSRGDYSYIHPIDHVNMHQSTNDVYPTALRVASLSLLKELETEVAALQQGLQQKEDEFKNVVKLGRTQLQDAVPMTLGMEFGAYAEAIARDRWRIFKARERIKQVNLGGTAIGTGLGAPTTYIFRVVDNLRAITGLNISRAENLIDATQNLDTFVEASGMLKAYACNLMKIASDLRLLGSGPDTGFHEIELPPRQAGSTIMAGKINPVMPEMMSQVGLRVIANDQVVALAASMGQLELNQLLPLLTHTIMESLEILLRSTCLFVELCINGVKANSNRCMDLALKSKSIATVLVPLLGYNRVEAVVKEAMLSGKTAMETAVSQGLITESQVEDLLAPKRMYKLGFSSTRNDERE